MGANGWLPNHFDLRDYAIVNEMIFALPASIWTNQKMTLIDGYPFTAHFEAYKTVAVFFMVKIYLTGDTRVQIVCLVFFTCTIGPVLWLRLLYLIIPVIRSETMFIHVGIYIPSN